VRFASIPAVCAAIVALASSDPRGRALALGILALVFCIGFAMHAREIIFGRTADRPTRAKPQFGTGGHATHLP
jgi:hypothetical protein